MLSVDHATTPNRSFGRDSSAKNSGTPRTNLQMLLQRSDAKSLLKDSQLKYIRQNGHGEYKGCHTAAGSVSGNSEGGKNQSTLGARNNASYAQGKSQVLLDAQNF